MTIAPILTLTYTYVKVYFEAHDSPTDTTCDTNYSYALNTVPYLLVDISITILLVYLFISKLVRVIGLANSLNQVKSSHTQFVMHIAYCISVT